MLLLVWKEPNDDSVESNCIRLFYEIFNMVMLELTDSKDVLIVTAMYLYFTSWYLTNYPLFVFCMHFLWCSAVLSPLIVVLWSTTSVVKKVYEMYDSSRLDRLQKATIARC